MIYTGKISSINSPVSQFRTAHTKDTIQVDGDYYAFFINEEFRITSQNFKE
jgi:hypothetical protein